jgi:hypothetical protein
MRIAILGAAGFVGRAAAVALAGRAEVRELLLVDYDIRGAKGFAKALSPKCRWAMADVSRAPELARLLGDVDAVASAVGPCPEYETKVLLTCARARAPAASIGDGTLSGEERSGIDAAFRDSGVAGVSGCGLLPGWTELLAAHFLGGDAAREPAGAEGPPRFLFCSPDRFGGYAFFRRIIRDGGGAVPAPRGSPRGSYFEAGARGTLGLPDGRPAALYRRFAGAGRRGAVGRELSAAILYWLRRFLKREEESPAAACGVWDPSGTGGAAVRDPDGRLAGALLAETAVRLALSRGRNDGLLALPEVVGRGDAERIAESCGGEIVVG